MAAPCIIGGGQPRPIGGIGGMSGIMPGGGQPIIGARIPRPIGAICFCAGPPTQRTGPYRPAGTDDIFKGTPRPAARPMPGPPAPGIGTLVRPSSGGGGPSTVNDTIFPPCSSTHPKTRFSSRSGPLAFFERILRNSSQSPSIRFMCLSKALDVPKTNTNQFLIFPNSFFFDK